MRQGLPTVWMMAAGYQARFAKVGGRHIYLLISHPDAWPGMEPVAVLLPVEKGGDAKGMMAFFKALLPDDSMTVSQLGEDLVYVGQALPLKRFEAMKAATLPPHRRADIEAGLMATEGAALQVVFAPTKDVRRALAELMPRLPTVAVVDPMDASTDFLTRGLKAVTLRVDLPPTLKVQLSFAMESEKDAMKVGAMLTKGLEVLKTNKEFLEQAPKEVRDFVGGLKPQTFTVGSGSTSQSFTSITLDEQGVLAMVKGVMPGVDKGRVLAQRSQSARNIRGIISSCIIYAAQNKDEWPESFDVLVKQGMVNEKMLVNPLDPQHRRYEYHRWTKEQLKKLDAESTPVVWEVTDDPQAGLNIGYVDCHVDFCSSRKDLDEGLKKAEARRKEGAKKE